MSIQQIGFVLHKTTRMVEIRNPNIEIRNNLKIEMTQIQNNSSSQAAVGEYTYGTSTTYGASYGINYADYTEK